METSYWAVVCKGEVATKDGLRRCGSFLFVSEIPDPRHPHPLGRRTFDLTCGVCHQRRSYTEKDLVITLSFPLSPPETDPARLTCRMRLDSTISSAFRKFTRMNFTLVASSHFRTKRQLSLQRVPTEMKTSSELFSYGRLTFNPVSINFRPVSVLSTLVWSLNVIAYRADGFSPLSTNECVLSCGPVPRNV